MLGINLDFCPRFRFQAHILTRSTCIKLSMELGAGNESRDSPFPSEWVERTSSCNPEGTSTKLARFDPLFESPSSPEPVSSSASCVSDPNRLVHIILFPEFRGTANWITVAISGWSRAPASWPIFRPFWLGTFCGAIRSGSLSAASFTFFRVVSILRVKWAIALPIDSLCFP